MIEIIEWLIKIEKLASITYSKLACEFRDDPEIFPFLTQLAEDENIHYKLMTEAIEFLKSHALKDKDEIRIDSDIKEKLESPFLSLDKDLNNKTFTKNKLFEFIAQMETSEWNKYFLYVVHHLTLIDDHFCKMASTIQKHEQRIEEFLLGKTSGRVALEKLKKLKKIWPGKLLIIDDCGITRLFLKSILNEYGTIDEATNGQEGLQKIGMKHYDVIITDVEMPHVSGIEMYEQIEKEGIKCNLVFMTGNQDHEHFFKENDLRYLIKPISPIELMDLIQQKR